MIVTSPSYLAFKPISPISSPINLKLITKCLNWILGILCQACQKHPCSLHTEAFFTSHFNSDLRDLWLSWRSLAYYSTHRIRIVSYMYKTWAHYSRFLYLWWCILVLVVKGQQTVVLFIIFPSAGKIKQYQNIKSQFGMLRLAVAMSDIVRWQFYIGVMLLSLPALAPEWSEALILINVGDNEVAGLCPQHSDS